MDFKYLISFIVATCNRKDDLLNLLENLKQNGLKKHEFEIIVSDDTDPENSYKEEIEHVAKTANIKYTTNNRHRHSAGFTKWCGMDLAEGKWVAFVDDDDEIVPNVFKYLKPFLDSNKKISMIETSYLTKNENGEISKESGYYNCVSDEFFRKILKRNILTHGKIFRTEFLVKYHITYDPNPSHQSYGDAYINSWVNIQSFDSDYRKLNLSHDKYSYYIFKQNPDSLTRTNNYFAEKIENIFNCFEKPFEIIEQNPKITNQAYFFFENYIIYSYLIIGTILKNSPYWNRRKERIWNEFRKKCDNFFKNCDKYSEQKWLDKIQLFYEKGYFLDEYSTDRTLEQIKNIVKSHKI